MKTTISSYEQTAIDFLKSTNVEFKAEFLKYGKHFDDDKDERAIYKITLSRGSRSYSFNFGQSIARSYPYNVREHLRNKLWNEQTTGGKYGVSEAEFKKLRIFPNIEKDILKNEDYAIPSAYDVLACVQKYEVGSFENFCSEFGYDTDSHKAEKTYKAVCDEYLNISRLFNESELELMREIQ